MFDFLSIQYKFGKVGINELNYAVSERWITEAEMALILGENKE